MDVGGREDETCMGATATTELNGSSSSSELGTLHATVKYDFDKTALVVTIAGCKNLPAKDAAAKSRYEYTTISTKKPLAT